MGRSVEDEETSRMEGECRAGEEDEDAGEEDDEGDCEWYFWDLLPGMGQKLGEEGLMQELARGFQQLADPRSGTITLESLRREGRRLGFLQQQQQQDNSSSSSGMSEAQLQSMMRLGGGCGDHLTLHQFCVAILRSSPALLHLALSFLLLGPPPPALDHQDNILHSSTQRPLP